MGLKPFLILKKTKLDNVLKMKNKNIEILAILERQERWLYGSDIQALATTQFWLIPLFFRLVRLECEGCVKTRIELNQRVPKYRRRFQYRITDKGKRAYKTYLIIKLAMKAATSHAADTSDTPKVRA